MGLGAGLEGYEKSRPHRCSIPGPFNPIVQLWRPGRKIKLTSAGNRDIRNLGTGQRFVSQSGHGLTPCRHAEYTLQE
jgi:hypothetical protein